MNKFWGHVIGIVFVVAMVLFVQRWNTLDYATKVFSILGLVSVLMVPISKGVSDLIHRKEIQEEDRKYKKLVKTARESIDKPARDS